MDNEVVLAIAVPGGGVDTVSEPDIQPLGAPGREPHARFRRRLERFKGVADAHDLTDSLDDEAELRLQLMLVREENARLKAARHKPPDAGTVIDRVRLLSAPRDEGEALDGAWTLLGECLVIREGLDQARIEVQAAINGVRERLAALAVTIESTTPQRSSGADAASQISA
jgi:hypothetical protein